MRVAILAHSVNPRGGVAHALSLGEALVRLGHDAVVHAPDVGRRGFFREAACAVAPFPARPVTGDVAALVETRIADYLRHFAHGPNRRFDLFHAQDAISANALAQMVERGLITGFARTVHHIDAFEDPRLTAWQERSIVSAGRHFVVSDTWREALAIRYGLDAALVGNGVDLTLFSAVPDGREAGLRARYAPGDGPVLLAVGGVEGRKNTRGLIAAFALLRRELASARLVIAGGVSLLDHSAERAAFDAALAAEPGLAEAVTLTGAVAAADMPALYRMADALAFPSLKEGFGLVVLEAMASGVPVVVSRIAPFIEYLGENDVAWCDPADPASIARAMRASLDPALRPGLIARGFRVARTHDWDRVAAAHLPSYRDLAARTLEAAHA